MWAATIKQKGIVDKSFLVNVLYDNGATSFNEIIDMTGGSLDVLSQKIQSRLTTLNTTQALIPLVTLGSYIAQPATQANGAFLSAVKHFKSCQQAVALGLILSTDPIFTAAQATMIAAYDPSFIDSI